MHEFFWSAITNVRAPEDSTRRTTPPRLAVARTRTSHRKLSPAGLVALFFVSLYLLTMGGHFDSPDEELMFQVTRNLVERGSMDIGATVSPERLTLAGVDGRAYVPYGPVSPVLSIPFYQAGTWLGALLPPSYAEVAQRFGVSLRDPIVMAIACVLFYALAIELNFRSTVALALTLAFGAATLIWPYSKYSWSEPVTCCCLLLSVYSAVRTVRTGRLGWSALTAVGLGLAIGSKITTAIVAPVLLVYLLGAGKETLRARIWRVAPFAFALLIPAVGLAALNLERFGDPLQTGYHLDGLIDLSQPIGIAGLLVSPSKSVFLYAPPSLIGIIGLWWMTSRMRWEAGLFFFIVATHVVLYGVLAIWSGDAAWGPRYLVPVVPFLVLPAGAVLEWAHGLAHRIAWYSFIGLSVVGVFVNLGGVLVDQRVSFAYLLNLADDNLDNLETLRWNPELSPVLIHWNEFGKRLSTFAHVWSQPVTLVAGTYAKETVEPIDANAARLDLFPRWTSGSAVFDVKDKDQPLQLTLLYTSNRPDSLGSPDVQVLVDGTPVPANDVQQDQSNVALPDKRYPFRVKARLDDVVAGRDAVRVEIRSRTWEPARDAPPSGDIRDLGILIWDVQFQSANQELPIIESPVSPMPVTEAKPWSYEVETWFYVPPHLADVWLWYLYLSGLPPWLMLLGLVPIAGLVVSVGLLRGYVGAVNLSRDPLRQA